MTDPYEPPDAPLENPGADDDASGVTIEVASEDAPPCKDCGSSNTVRSLPDDPVKLGVIQFILLGWLSVLIRVARTIDVVTCQDCDYVSKHRPASSRVAILILVILAGWLGLLVMDSLANP